MSRKLGLAGAIAAVVAVATLVPVLATNPVTETSVGSTIPLTSFVRNAELVFEGRVLRIAYKNSEPVPLLDVNGAPILDEDRRPAMQDGSDTPHAFVTFKVVRVHKGRAPGPTITLRFFGGIDDQMHTDFDDAGNEVPSPMFVHAGHYPLFDVGDTDLLFVQGNTDKPCPLILCEVSRLRLIGGRVYDDRGREIDAVTNPRTGRPALVYGPPHELREVSENTIGGYPAGGSSASAADEAEPGQDRLGEHLRGSDLTKLVGDVVRRLYTRAELRRMPRTPSADITAAFVARPFVGSTPPPEPPPGPTEDPYEGSTPEDRAERERRAAESQAAIDANGGNPVLPTTGATGATGASS